MKYIFLDVDGVLNTSFSWTIKRYALHMPCIECLAKICKKANAHIVLTSSWKTGFYKRASKTEWTPQIQDLVEKLHKYEISIYDRTPDLKDKRRDEEITAYLEKHPADSYVILDDDLSLFDAKTPNLYQVNCQTGLTKSDIKQVVKMLK